jgi:RNA polymerase sigma factor (sigma-70 family)
MGNIQLEGTVKQSRNEVLMGTMILKKPLHRQTNKHIPAKIAQKHMLRLIKPEPLRKAVMPRLSEKDEQELKILEKAIDKKCSPLTREREYFVAKLFARFAKKSKRLAKAASKEKDPKIKAVILEEIKGHEKMKARLANVIVMSQYNHIRIIAHSVRKLYKAYKIPVNDLINEGAIGGRQAMEGFDYKRGNRYSTYATWYIREQITHYIVNNFRLVRIPVPKNNEITQIYREMRRFKNLKDREPTPAEISKNTGISLEIVNGVLRMNPNAGSVQLDRKESDPDSDRPYKSTVLSEFKELLDECLRTLHPRDEEILRRRTGLWEEGMDIQTLEEVGQIFGITRERIRQLQNIAIRKLLRAALRSGLQTHMKDEDISQAYISFKKMFKKMNKKSKRARVM